MVHGGGKRCGGCRSDGVSRFSNSGSLAILAAMRRANSGRPFDFFSGPLYWM